MSHFEKVLALWIGRQQCAACKKSLGNGPRYHSQRLMYHPECLNEE